MIAQGNDPYLYLPQLLKNLVGGYYKVVINLQSPGSTSVQLFYLDNNNQDYNEKTVFIKRCTQGKINWNIFWRLKHLKNHYGLIMHVIPALISWNHWKFTRS